MLHLKYITGGRLNLRRGCRDGLGITGSCKKHTKQKFLSRGR
jgi:hypothetical protein